MDLKQLKYFMTIVEEQQITAAARRLHMAQPPLSHQMKMLEQELGTTLFERGPHQIELTDAGQLLAQRAEQLLTLADSTRREIDDLNKGLRGTLHLGTISSSGSILLNPGLHRFHLEYPDVHFEIHDANTYQLIDLLRQGIIEIGIVRTPFPADSFNCIYLKPEPMVAAMTGELDWCPDRSHIPLKELDQRPLIIYRRFDPLLRDAFSHARIQPVITCRNDDARTTVLWANAGLGIAVIPASAVSLAAHDRLHVKNIDEPALKTRMTAIWRRDRYLSHIAQKFLNALSYEKEELSCPSK